MAEGGSGNSGNIKRSSTFKDWEKCLESLLIMRAPLSLWASDMSGLSITSPARCFSKSYSVLCETEKLVGFGSYLYCSHA